MNSNDSKISPTWIEITRGTFGACIGTWRFPFSRGFVLILMMFFYFQDISEMNGIQIPFTIGI
jgi:hypothetical protein